MEDQEEQQQGHSLIANVVQMIILFWSLGVISWSYFNPNPTRQIDTTFAAGLLSAVTAQYGLNIKKNNDNKINFILLKKIGKTTSPGDHKLSTSELKKYFPKLINLNF